MMNKGVMAMLLSPALLALVSCAKPGTTVSANGESAHAVSAPGEVAGFEEFPIGDDIELGPLNVAGDFVPYLTIKYELEKDGKLIEGNFMPMNADDGPHYGANVKFGEAGTYKVRFIITNPEAQGYLLHVDNMTGVHGHFWREPLVAEWDFDFVPRGRWLICHRPAAHDDLCFQHHDRGRGGAEEGKAVL
jgi:periplasmic iron binding protein